MWLRPARRASRVAATTETRGALMTVLQAALRPPFQHHDFDPVDLARARWRSGTRISVCLPARNEAATVGRIIRAIRRDLVEACSLVDEVVLMDDGSSDGTADEARRAGARVETVAAVLPQVEPGHGKGNAMWRSLFVTEGDLICWVGAGIRGFGPPLLTGLPRPPLL